MINNNDSHSMNSDVFMMKQEVIEMFSTIVEDKDVYTAGHSKRVAMYSAKLAEALGLSEEEQTTIYQAGLLHDVGKVLTPESILLKPRKFNRHEYEIIKSHATDGERIVSSISVFAPCAKIILHHHEHYDGNGYPEGLKADEIPLLSRIIAVADAFDAMTTNRIFKARKTMEKALEELEYHSGTQFDPNVVKVAKEAFVGLKNIVHSAQAPESNSLQEERFSYYFKDSLTGAYSADYLDYFLQNNNETKLFRCCHFIQISHMQSYNECYGWKAGDNTLKEIAHRIKILFETNNVFRIFGDDFIILHTSHFEINEEHIIERLTIGFELLEVTLKHFDMNEKEMHHWCELENDLAHYDATGEWH